MRIDVYAVGRLSQRVAGFALGVRAVPQLKQRGG